ncbi:zinc finger MYM-type protein 1-like isoform X2 [Cynara cardunculus var. scolymus]|uniref:zinc finger MYM-type protein 1-like isoform X2 n=1 Tax=Cynara cardunculus var. scolymus TaxID=59895 RepID=UPI000D624FD0|nr:zinc finger MYM-type protein 1-like isoform X2 [Cynara cardunculus var. scolymus]
MSYFTRIMKRFLKRKVSTSEPDGGGIGGESSNGNVSHNNPEPSSTPSMAREVDMNDLSWDIVPTIQKDIVHCFAQEVLKAISEEISDDVFALLVDGSNAIPKRKQMVVVLRYVTCGIVKERFIGFVHVMETDALSLKSAIESLFVEYGLSLKKVRGQSYNGASNMHVGFNVAKEHLEVGKFFDMIDVMINAVCASCKPKDMIRESQREKVQEAIGNGEIETESGLKQEISHVKPEDIRWGSYYKTLLYLVDLFPSVVEVLAYVEEVGVNPFSQRKAYDLQVYFQSFDFVFYLHLMLHILGVTDLLSQALQRRDEDILNAISLVKSTKQLLQKFKVDGFHSLLKMTSSFSEKHDIEMLNLDDEYVNPKIPRQKTNITYRHYYEFHCFNTIVDMQIEEFDDRFSGVSSELLICMAALNPRDSFCDFNPSKLLRLTELYPDDFSCVEKVTLEPELYLYIDSVQQDERFANLKGISDLARVMVETRLHLTFPLVYRLLKLALVLPVATATVESCFSAIELVKSDLRDRICDDFYDSCVSSAVEEKGVANVTNEDVMNHIEKMKARMNDLRM